jgi:glycerol-3-phosphate dehydrogenase (NAD(P)+)
MNIVIIGAGEIGRAMEKILKEKPNSSDKIFLWDKNQGKVSGQKPLEEIAPPADFIFLCIPSFAVEEFLTTIKPSLNPKTIIISLAKGIGDSGRTMAEVLGDNLSGGFFGLLCGPMLAEEIMLGKKTFAILAIKNGENYEKTARLFSGTNLQIFQSSDIKGAAIASVLKNIYSVLFGICDGLSVGSNFKGRLLVEILKEIKKIILFFGGRPETAENLAGLGDFFATATSAYSKNYQSGIEIAKTKTCSLAGEGIMSFNNLKKRLGNEIDRFPLLKILDKILNDPAKADLLLEELA